MPSPDIDTLASVVLAANAAHNTKHAPVFEQIRNYVWNQFHDASADDIPWASPVEDVAGCGAAIYAEFVSAGVSPATGGIAWWLEQLGNKVLTYPYTRSETGVLDVPTS